MPSRVISSILLCDAVCTSLSFQGRSRHGLDGWLLAEVVAAPPHELCMCSAGYGRTRSSWQRLDSCHVFVRSS